MIKHQRNYSSKKAQTTRVKVKPRKKTVGITLTPKLVKKARKHKLNISRITEQALNSIIDYLETRKTTKSSKFLNERSFLKESSKPRWPSLVGHCLGKAEVAGSKPARGSILMCGLCCFCFVWVLLWLLRSPKIRLQLLCLI
jgi:post-segregation antitoxin (ccd killing protein)